MNREKKMDGRTLHLIRQGVRSENEMSDMIDKEMVTSRTKTKSWKMLDTYLKWQAITTYLAGNGVDSSAFEKYKKAFLAGKLSDIEYDHKRQTIVCLNYKGR